MTFVSENLDEPQPAADGAVPTAIVQQILEGCALNSVEIDSAERSGLLAAVRETTGQLARGRETREYAAAAQATLDAFKTHNQRVERFIHDLFAEKQAELKLLSQSLLKVSHASKKSGQRLRQLEKDLGQASRLQDMRELRAKLGECLTVLCAEAEAQEARHLELANTLMADAGKTATQHDPLTALGTLKAAELRMQEIGGPGQQAFVLVFFLKNLEFINRRFGFPMGDEALRRFAEYLGKQLKGSSQLFRWRGPCFVAISEDYGSLHAAQAEAQRIGGRGLEQAVERDGKAIFIRMTAATAVFLIPKGPAASTLSAQIDQFAANQLEAALSPR